MKKVPIDKNAYSESSKRSVGHEFLGDFYADINYKCSKCKKPEVFSAQDQKEAYEVRKEYMWAKRKLCDVCWHERKAIEKQLKDKEQWYAKNKEQALKDSEFLHGWLSLLQEYPKYGKKSNPARVKFIQNAIKNT